MTRSGGTVKTETDKDTANNYVIDSPKRPKLLVISLLRHI